MAILSQTMNGIIVFSYYDRVKTTSIEYGSPKY